MSQRGRKSWNADCPIGAIYGAFGTMVSLWEKLNKVSRAHMRISLFILLFLVAGCWKPSIYDERSAKPWFPPALTRALDIANLGGSEETELRDRIQEFMDLKDQTAQLESEESVRQEQKLDEIRSAFLSFLWSDMPKTFFDRLTVKAAPFGADKSELAGLAAKNSEKLNVMFDSEWEAIREAGQSSSPMIGLALSGGGIRSASFASGVLVALNELRLLDRIGYMSSVSGGGFAAAWYMVHRREAPLAPGSPSLQRLSRMGNYLNQTHYSRHFVNFLGKSGFWVASVLYDVSVLPSSAGLSLGYELPFSSNTAPKTLYRNGISQAFLGGKDYMPIYFYYPDQFAPHFWVINCNVSMIDESRPELRGRPGDLFEITPLRTGSDATGYVVPLSVENMLFPFSAGPLNMFQRMYAQLLEFNHWCEIGSAVAVSGAALDRSSLSFSWWHNFMLWLTHSDLGYRIGRWKPTDRGERFSWLLRPEPELSLGYILLTPFRVFIGGPLQHLWYVATDWMTQQAERHDADNVKITDGGHFDNLGCYALVKRGVRLIIVADAGYDPDFQYPDLRRLELLIKADFGASLAVDWHAIPKLNFLTAKILNLPIRTETGNVLKDVTLIFVKAAVFDDVATLPGFAQQSTRDTQFPQDPTSDQFFTEQQVVSYRELGRQIVLKHGSEIRKAMDNLSGKLAAKRLPEDGE